MAGIEKVKKGLVCCTNMDRCFGKCPYDDEYDDVVDCTSELAKDALEAIKEQQAEIERLNALLKEQEAVEPKEIVDEHFPIGDFRRTIGWLCGKCGEELMGAENYCSNCGQAVKWE